MPGVDDGIRFPAPKLRAWTEQVFQKVGVSKEDAVLLTDSLIEANLRGVDTHGITRMLCVYVKRMQVGVVNPKTELKVLREHPSTALIDCKNSIGQVASNVAMRTAIEKAKTTGVAFVATTHSNHYGAAAYWAMMALDHGMIGLSSTNAPAVVAPTGSRTPMLGTNPFAVAIPAGQEQPMVLDLATTVVARGRILLYAKQNKPLEPGWAFDELGRPDRRPARCREGAPRSHRRLQGVRHRARDRSALRRDDRLELRDALPRVPGGQSEGSDGCGQHLRRAQRRELHGSARVQAVDGQGDPGDQDVTKAEGVRGSTSRARSSWRPRPTG